jgi:hypothetical protein
MATTYPPVRYRLPVSDHGRASRDNVPVYLAVALGYLLLLPPQLNLVIGTTVLPPYRFLLIPGAVYMIASGLRGAIRIGWVDVLIILASAWVSLALFMTTPAGDAFTAAIAQTTDIALAYFFGRFTLRSLRDLRLFLVLMAPGLALIAATMVLEAVSHRLIIQDIFGRLTGRGTNFRVSDPRFGLFRAFGPFPHPILAGIFLSSFLPLYFLSGLRGWPKYMGIFAAFCSFFSVSSAALLGLVVGGALMIYGWLSERIANLTWRLFFLASAIFVFVAELATGAGSFGLIMRFASLNSVSSYNRVLIWEFGTRSVAKHPWFGIGYAEWERPAWMSTSMDHFWLLVAVRFGIIPSVLLAIAAILAVLLLMRAAMVTNGTDKRTYQGVAISLGVFALGVISVALWLSAHIWFFMLIGISVSIAAAGQARAIPARLPAPARLGQPAPTRQQR